MAALWCIRWLSMFPHWNAAIILVDIEPFSTRAALLLILIGLDSNLVLNGFPLSGPEPAQGEFWAKKSLVDHIYLTERLGDGGQPGPLNSAYATAKVALNQFTRHLALVLRS